jgi:protein-L-isoaspartate(D-aspartate) O-methyltransferase
MGMPLFHFMPARCFGLLLSGLAMMAGGAMTEAFSQDALDAARRKLLDEIAQMTRDSRLETGRGALSERVMAAMAKVPRQRFVSEGDERRAYENRPLSIGSGQTISQPFIVALMTDLMDIKAGHRVLEIGTGSGYQAAVLAELAGTVYTIEIVESLGQLAAKRFTAYSYGNIVARIGDGYKGWPEHAPFDSIMVTAAARDVPQPLIEQLKPGGKLVIPLGAQSGAQTLYVVEKRADGTTARRAVLAVRFVPLTDPAGKQR